MILSRLVSALVMMGLDHLVQAYYGFLGVLTLLALTAALRPSGSAEGRDTGKAGQSHGTVCLSLGAVVFVLLMTQA
ncbi:hypothetical protein AB0F77_23255 [Streptomyces sp. NPDC026672]|uniref:hypothetical protein n=1 Tax=unclassified Streptomyces TaxID=2593676 RepID=UPI0033C8834F